MFKRGISHGNSASARRDSSCHTAMAGMAVVEYVVILGVLGTVAVFINKSALLDTVVAQFNERLATILFIICLP